MSLPAVNTRPEPVMSTAPIAASFPLSSKAARIMSYISRVRAFFFAGLVIAMMQMPSLREIMTSLPVTGRHSAAEAVRNAAAASRPNP